MIKSLFASEMRLLHEEAQHFAEMYPEQAAKLNLRSLKDRDPYVERLFEGMAFLSAHVKARIDADMPEIAETYLQQVCPTLLQTLASAVIVQMNADEHAHPEPLQIPKGTICTSQPVGPDQITCGFRSIADGEYLPLSITQVQYEDRKLTLSFKWMKGVSLEKLSLSSIPLYIHADSDIALTLYQWLLSDVQSVALNQKVLGGQSIIQPCHLNTQETLLPASERGLDAFHLWLDYFACREKYIFLQFTGLVHIDWTLVALNHQFDVEIHLKTSRQEHWEIKKHYFLLNCVPFVNLYSHQAEPLRITQTQYEYTLIPEASRSEGIQIQTVDVVYSILNSEKRYCYKPVHDVSENENIFSIHKNTYENNFPKYRLSLSGHIPPEGERIACTLTVHNGYYPRNYLMENQLQARSQHIPKTLRITNITRPSKVCACPFQNDMLWQCIAYLSMNIDTLSDIESLKKCLKLLDWTNREDNRKRIDAIQTVQVRSVQYIRRGAYCRGVEYHITLDEKGFLNAGDQYLFGRLLHQFLSFFVAVNYTVKTIVHGSPSDQVICFEPIMGTQCPL